MKNKNFFLIIAGIIIFVIAALLLWNSLKEKPEYVEPKSDIEQMVSDDQGSDAVINESNEKYPEETKVSITVTGDEVVNLYAEIARLEAELAACMEGKEPKSSVATTPARTTRKSITKRQAPSKSETSTSTTSAGESSRISNPNIAISQYEGVIAGDFGATFDGDGKLFYYVKNLQSPDPNAASLINIKNRNTTETHLNGKFGVLGTQVGDYLIFKTGTVVTVDRLEGEPLKFAIYIGDYLYGTKYDMWLPHEFVKLNESLATSPGIQANDEGGFAYVTKINYKARGK